jgi:hypothetical protein
MVLKNLDHIEYFMLYAHALLLAFFTNKKQKNPQGTILARLCLPKMVLQNLGLMGSYIENSKLHILAFILPSPRNRNK